MFNAGASIIMLKDCRVIGNKGYNGGGLYNNSSVECVIVNTFYPPMKLKEMVGECLTLEDYLH